MIIIPRLINLDREFFIGKHKLINQNKNSKHFINERFYWAAIFSKFKGEYRFGINPDKTTIKDAINSGLEYYDFI